LRPHTKRIPNHGRRGLPTPVYSGKQTNAHTTMKRCKYCNEVIKECNTFCNSSCAASYNNSKHPKRTPKIVKSCPNCGGRVLREDCRFCSRSCRMQYKINNGIKLDPKTIRRYYLKLRGLICEECKNTHWNGLLIPLDIHHIDGNPRNNRPENIRVLCPNCHTQTDNYKSKNRKIF
jgi:hypothetical protein